MRKKVTLIVAVLLILAVSLSIIIWKNNISHQSENTYAGDYNDRVNDENGMYYVNSIGYLVFMDADTGDIVPVCSKANCSHNDSGCDAYYSDDAMGCSILLYDDKIYISYFTQEVNADFTDDNEFIASVDRVARIEASKKDGSSRKIIYEAESGAVTSMFAMDGKLYYTAYTTQSNIMDTPQSEYYDSALYCYDMDWGKTKELLKYEGGENYCSGTLSMINTAVETEKLYLVNQYEDKDAENDEVSYARYAEYMVIDLKGNIISSKKLLYDADYVIDVINADGEDALLSITDYDETQGSEGRDCIEALYEYYSDESMNEIFSIENGDIVDVGDGFWLLIADEKNKVLVNYDDEIYYIAKSANTDEHIVPDIYIIDEENDVIYYDATDYTGVEEGTVYYEDPSEPSCMKLSDFLEAYFVKTENADEMPDKINVY